MLRSAELRSADFAQPKVGLRVPADLCCRELGPRLDRKAPWRTAKDYRRVGDHQARVIRLKDAGRRQNPRDGWRLPDHSPFSHNREERNDQRA